MRQDFTALMLAETVGSSIALQVYSFKERNCAADAGGRLSRRGLSPVQFLFTVWRDTGGFTRFYKECSTFPNRLECSCQHVSCLPVR